MKDMICMKPERKKSKIRPAGLVLILILAGLTFGGCVNLSDDITPPPATAAATEIEPTQTEQEADSALEPTPTSRPVEENDEAQEQQAPADTEVIQGVVTVDLVNQGAQDLEGAEVSVRLEGFDHMTQAYTGTADVTAGESVRFEDVPLAPGRLFFASVNYQGAVYRSDIAQVEGEEDQIALEVEIFGTTTDQSGLSIDRVHIFVDFPAPEVVQIGEMFVISNFGEQTVVAGESDEVVLEFPLPEEAANLTFQNGALGERFRKTAAGFGDTASIPPGSGVYQVMAFYDLPYQRSRLSFEQEMSLPVGAVIIMTPVGGIQVRDSQIEDLGVRQIQNGSIQVYVRENVRAGEAITFDLSGKPADTAGDAGPVGSGQGRTSLLIGLGVLGLVLVGVGLWFYRRLNQEQADDQFSRAADSRQDILDEIITLDDQFAAGQIGEEQYRDRRAALKERLRSVMEGEKAQA